MKNRNRTRLFNRLRFILDRGLTVANVLDKAAAAHGDSPIFYLDQPLPYEYLGPVVTPRELLVFAQRLGNGLRQRCGMGRYDRVAIYKENAGDYFFLGLGVMRAGGIAVPIHGHLPPASLARYLAYTGSRILLTDGASYHALCAQGVSLEGITVVRVDGGEPGTVSLAEMLAGASDRLKPVPLTRDDDVLIVHTSGTTGFPKGVIHTSGTLVAGIRGQLEIEPIWRDQTALTAAPFNHFINYLGLLSALVAKVPTWLVSHPEPAAVLELIERERINVVFCFPHTYLGMYKQGLDGHDLCSVRLWLAGADSSHEAHIRAFTRHGAFLRLCGRPLIRSLYVDTLGSSEVGFAALFRFTFSFSKRFARYVGRSTFAGPRVKIADATGRPVRPGRVGRVMVKGPTLFKGYWNAHDKLHGVVRDGWWWTGDVGYRDRWGRYYHVDRDVDVIHTESGPVYTLPLEELLLNYPGVAEAVVVGRDTDAGSQQAIALVEPLPGQAIAADPLRQWVNSKLPVSSQLSEIRVVVHEDIPRGLTGKVLKRLLQQRPSSGAVTLAHHAS